MGKSRSGKSAGAGKRRGLSILFGAGCMAVILGAAVSAEPDDEYRMPELICPQPDGTGGWYQTGPDIKIIHTDPDGVTRYKVETSSGKLLEGELRLEKKEKECADEKQEKESGSCPRETGKGEEPGTLPAGKKKENVMPSEQEEDAEEQKGGEEQEKEEGGDPEDTGDGQPEDAAVQELPAEIWEEGENRITVWMETPGSGKEICRMEKVFLLDKTDPGKVEFSYPSRPDDSGLYFRQGAEITMDCEDKGSGISEIICILADGTEKRLEGGHACLTLPTGYMGSVTAYAQDRAGRRGECSISRTVACEDEPPEVLLSVKGGFLSWHQGQPEISISVREPGERYGFSSGLSSVVCHVSGKTVMQKSCLEECGETGNAITEENISLKIEEASENGKPVVITVFAADRAGNTAVRTEELYIDRSAPAIRITGIRDGMITGEAVCAEAVAADENILDDVRLDIWRSDVNGNRTQIESTQPAVREDRGTEWRLNVMLEEDGVYEFTVSASDRAGHSVEQNGSFTIDRTSPVIRYVDQLNGASMRFFQWNYGKEEMVRDFTDYTYQMNLDGRLYLSGDMETEEGIHLLEVKAEDAAGNQSYARAVFTIDHTPPEIHQGELEDGGVYKERVLLSLWVDGEGERLKSLAINGERQKLSADSRIFQYEITEPGMYVVDVRADDLTGNESAERISFEVREREGLAAKIFRPVSGALLGKDEGGEEREGTLAPALLGAVGCAAVLCGILGRRIYLRRRQGQR